MPPNARPVLRSVENDDLDHLDEEQRAAVEKARADAANASMLDLLLATATQTDRALKGDTSIGDEDLVQQFTLKRSGFSFWMHPVTDGEMDACRERARKRLIDPSTGRGVIAEGEYRNRMLYAATVKDQPGNRTIWDLAAERLGVAPPVAWQVIEPKVLLVGERDQAFGRLLELSGYRNDAQLVDAAKN